MMIDDQQNTEVGIASVDLTIIKQIILPYNLNDRLLVNAQIYGNAFNNLIHLPPLPSCSHL